MQSIAQPLTRTTRSLLVLVACLVASCSTYRNVLVTNAPTTIQEDDGVRVTTMTGEEHTFRVVAIDAEGLTGPEHTFPYTEIVMIERREVDVMRSLYGYLAVGLVLLLV